MANKTTGRRRYTQTSGQSRIYVDGNAVRQTVVAPKRQPDKSPAKRRKQSKITHNRANAKRMGKLNILFLAVVSAASVFMCVQYIQLRSTVTNRLDQAAKLESQLTTLTTENDALYNDVRKSVDVNNIRDVAIGQLGMKYAAQDQIIIYDQVGNSYVNQYQSVPATQ